MIRSIGLAVATGVGALLLGACTGSEGNGCPTDTGEGCAPAADRVDLYEPTFSNPTSVTNPHYPVSSLHSVVFTGHVDGKPFRTETTLLPETLMIDWNGQQVETLVQQYMAFSDGRLEEIALDWFAQDDLGAVWYFGEDVADYDETGTIFTHEGTWLVGRDGELAMNMPATPEVGNAWLAENAEPAAWEQITVTSVDDVRDGPSGQISGIVVGEELKLDGETEQKLFAPGYGEFSTGTVALDNLEALALAIPTDAVTAPAPQELATLATSLADLFGAAESGDWTSAAAARTAVDTAWTVFRAGAVPPLLEAEADRLLAELTAAIDARDATQTRHQAIAVARVVYDLRLRHEPVADIDRVRFDLWLAQVSVDATAAALGPIRGDVATLELVWNRIAYSFDAAAATDVQTKLATLRTAADAEDVSQVTAVAQELRGTFASTGWH